MAACVAAKPGLKRLNLRENELEDEGAVVIAKASRGGVDTSGVGDMLGLPERGRRVGAPPCALLLCAPLRALPRLAGIGHYLVLALATISPCLVIPK